MPDGIDADAGHRIIGGRGRNVQIVDVEGSWTVPHEDMLALDDPKLFLGKKYTGGGNHGTAVVGIMVADRNGYGVRGIADAARLRVSSHIDGGLVNAIARAINASVRGDIILIEAQYNTPVGLMPVESSLADYNIILTATRKGIHVCEAAGNGGINLNFIATGGPSGYLNPTHKNFRDSGAIMIGASDGEKRTRAYFSNNGLRITANGWGATRIHDRLRRPVPPQWRRSPILHCRLFWHLQRVPHRHVRRRLSDRGCQLPR